MSIENRQKCLGIIANRCFVVVVDVVLVLNVQRVANVGGGGKGLKEKSADENQQKNLEENS